jgi:succinate dehydrogenase/fumarate reductase-like Fe-S protein
LQLFGSISHDQKQQDLKALQEIIVEENGKKLAVRTECRGVCGKVFQAVRVAIPQVIREVWP